MKKQRFLYNSKLASYIIIVVALIFIFLFFLLGFYARKVAYLESERNALEASKKTSIETQNYLSSAFHITRSFTNSSIILKKNKISRDVLIDMMYQYILNDSSFVALWLMWEPNMFDGIDGYYANKPPYDSNGTLAVTYYRLKGKILIEINEPEDFANDFYTVPKQKRKEVLTEPYLWNYTGSKEVFFETSVITPIIIDSIFHGIFAVDIDFRNLQQLHNKVQIYKSGYASLISNSGIIISHPDTVFIKKNIQKLFNQTSSAYWNRRTTNNILSYKTVSEFTGKKVLRVLNSLTIGNTGEDWYMLIEIPESEIKAYSNQLLVVSFIILIIGILLMIYLVFNLKIRRKNERQLVVEKLKAQESDKLKSAFMANMSHEIRTPMNGIVGFSELYLSPDISQSKRKYMAEKVIECSQQLLAVVNDILDISMIETGEIKFESNPVDLTLLLNELYTFYKPQAKEKKINIFVENSLKAEENMLITDEDKIRRVLDSLIKNSIKFTSKGYIKFGCKKVQNDILFYVEDSGIGILPTLHKKIFEPFRQAEIELTRQYGGNGLGLSISKKIIEFLGGRIWLESEPHKGSTFYFTLPNKN